MQQPMQAQGAAEMAALMNSLNGWSLNGQQGMPAAQQGGYGPPQHMQSHRAASFDSALPHHYLAQQAQQQGHHQVRACAAGKEGPFGAPAAHLWAGKLCEGRAQPCGN